MLNSQAGKTPSQKINTIILMEFFPTRILVKVRWLLKSLNPSFVTFSPWNKIYYLDYTADLEVPSSI